MDLYHMHIQRPQIHLDWTINISNIISILLGIFMLIGGYYNLKSEIAINQSTNEAKFQLVDRLFQGQTTVNASLNNKIDGVNSSLSQQLQASTADIKADIRELRVDVLTPPIPRK